MAVLLGGLGLAVAGFASEYADHGLVTAPGSLPLPRLVAWLGAWAWWAAGGATVTFLNKTVVFAVLAAFVTATYVAIVVAIGQAVRAVGRAGLGLSIVATALVAVLFELMRRRVQLMANKLVYGDVATPYDVVTDFSQRMSAALSLGDVLPGMAEAAAKGVRATRSRVRLFLPDGDPEEVTWPDRGDAPYGCTVAVVHQGEVVGDISVPKAPGEHLTSNDERLLSDLALQAGLAMRNLRLTGELEARLRELQASRERIVAAQDQERRRMERDLHDGAQQLIAISIKLRLTQGVLASGTRPGASSPRS